MTPTALTSRLRIVGAAVLFSTGGAAVKASTLTAWQLAGVRATLAGLFLLAVLPSARRIFDLRALPVGLLYGVMTVSYVAANKLTTAGNVMFLVAASPLVVLLLSRWWLGERATRGDLLFMLPMGVGVLLCLAPAQPVLETAPRPVLGNWIAVLLMVVWGALLVAMRALGRDERATIDLGPAGIALGNLLAGAVSLAVAEPFTAVSRTDWLVGGYLGIVQIGLAYVWLTAGLRAVPAFEGSLLLLAEPVLNPVWAWAVHGEIPSGWGMLGGAVILGSLAAKLWWVDRLRSRETAALAPDRLPTGR